jgi:hypothetical protein
MSATASSNESDATDVLPPDQDPLQWTYPHAVNRVFNCARPTKFRYKVETGVNNGDCMPACLNGILEALHFGYMQKVPKQRGAKQMRGVLVDYIKSKWDTCLVFQPDMRVHEIMWLQHDMGIPQSERAKRGEWPADPAGRLAAYSEQCDSVYFGEAEMMMFSCMMFELRGVLLFFRTFRTTGEDDEASGEHVANTPDDEILRANGFKEAIVVDLSHSGRVDGFTAHYRLLDSAGSLKGLLDVHEVRPRKRRLIKTGDLEKVGASSPSTRNGLDACQT